MASCKNISIFFQCDRDNAPNISNQSSQTVPVMDTSQSLLSNTPNISQSEATKTPDTQQSAVNKTPDSTIQDATTFQILINPRHIKTELADSQADSSSQEESQTDSECQVEDVKPDTRKIDTSEINKSDTCKNSRSTTDLGKSEQPGGGDMAAVHRVLQIVGATVSQQQSDKTDKTAITKLLHSGTNRYSYISPHYIILLSR